MSKKMRFLSTFLHPPAHLIDFLVTTKARRHKEN